MRGGSLWQLGQSITRRLAQSDKKPLSPRRYFASGADLKKTALYDFHVAHGGKMVPFAGWSMPIQYKDSIIDSTVNCRVNGSLFDVAHMCGLSLKGKDCVPFLETLVVADVAGLAPGTGSLTVFTNEKGGAIDDSVITKVTDEHIYLVVNAGCRDKDLAHIEEHMKAFKSKGGDVSWHIHDERSLLALQGPLAAPVLQHLTKEDLSKLYFGQFQILDINGSTCFLTRTGYTGEDGFEISVPSEHAVDLAKAILEKSEGKVRLTGLGARDSLRLEAGLCLYGNDMEQHITPVEAGLTWAIGKRRRAEGGFLGADVILKQLQDGPTIRRVGFFSSGPPARSHSEVHDESGNKIGEITSGGFSPNLKKNIAMGYVKSGQHKNGTKVKILVRGKPYEGNITKMPFVATKYYKPT
ncbi:aminomethyltransferase, mitochondrial [Brassica napus]|nr:aminomethyltransferase, mitochondrial [Brassica napus]XP_048594201.1 aminomethyltransferase, mitochondrial [Brassica napus]